MRRSLYVTIVLWGIEVVLSITGCGINTSENESINEETAKVLWSNCYVSTTHCEYGFFEISFFDDYSCSYGYSLNQADFRNGTWSVDEYNILTVYDGITDIDECNVICFEILPCMTDGVYRLEYMAEVSDGLGIEKCEIDILYPKYDYSYSVLDNVLGETANYVYYAGTMPLMGSYFLNDSLMCIDVWGIYPEDVVITDLDSDGRNELIASVMWGDGVEDVLIYTATEEGIMKAYGSSILEYDSLDDYAWAVKAKYLQESNMIGILYIPQGDSNYCYVEYELKLDRLAWEAY